MVRRSIAMTFGEVWSAKPPETSRGQDYDSFPASARDTRSFFLPEVFTMSKSSHRAKKSRQTSRFTKRYKSVEEMPVVNRHAAGIDLAGAASHFVAVEINDEIEVREFGGTTNEVNDMVAYMAAHNVTTVAMESTGVYWNVVYDLLEVSGIEVYLVNPSHVKNVPGRRKDDKLDCRWLQKLHKFGLLSASFRPNPEDRPMQSLQRQRTRIVELSAQEIQRMQQAMDMMNIRPHKELSDVGGVTGMRIIRAIVNGERDPAKLALNRDRRCASTLEELEAALTGYYIPEQVLSLKQALERYDLQQKHIFEIDMAMEQVLRGLIPMDDEEIAAKVASSPTLKPTGKHPPQFPVMNYLLLLTGKDATCIDGIGPATALSLLALLGRDFTKWKTAKHFTSHITLAPVQKISGGKLLKSNTRAGGHPVGTIFKQAAASVTRTDTALGAHYRSLALRVGRGKALTAIARKLAVQYYQLMRYDREYIDNGSEEYEERQLQRQIKALSKRASKLGLTLTKAA